MQGSVVEFSLDTLASDELVRASQLTPKVLMAVVEYCERKMSQIVEWFLAASRLYFESLSKTLRPDLTVVAITRLLDIHTAFPDQMNPVWEHAAPHINPKSWKGKKHIGFISLCKMFA